MISIGSNVFISVTDSTFSNEKAFLSSNLRRRISVFVRSARMNNLTGAILLALPCFLGLVCESPELSMDTVKLLIIFSLGAFLMRSAGCIANDYLDRKMDAKVPRCAKRPAAAGELNGHDAVLYICVCLIFAFPIFLSLKFKARAISAIFGTLAFLYPLCKRFFPIPQLVLAPIFSSGTLVASFQVREQPSSVGWALYFACSVWVFAYDLLYALQDAKYDAGAGVHSATLILKDKTIPVARALYLIYALILTSVIPTIGLHPIFYVFQIASWLALEKGIKLASSSDESSVLMVTFKLNAFSSFMTILGVFFGRII